MSVQRCRSVTSFLARQLAAGLVAVAVLGLGAAGTAVADPTIPSDAILSGTSTWSIPQGEGPGPNAAPSGANNWRCVPKAGQLPVVLVHGTWTNARDTFDLMSPALTKAGFCVYALNYGQLSVADGGGVRTLIPGTYGAGDIGQSAKQLAEFVDLVLDSTHSTKVNMVGHSQGGLLARAYLKFEAGAEAVENLVTLGATNHGTTEGGLTTLGRAIEAQGVDVFGVIGIGVGVAGIQQATGSDFLEAVNAGGDTLEGVNYTIVATRYDEAVTPYEATFLTAGPDATVNNLTVQDGCEIDTVAHGDLPSSRRVISITLRAFDETATAPLACAATPRSGK